MKTNANLTEKNYNTEREDKFMMNENLKKALDYMCIYSTEAEEILGDAAEAIKAAEDYIDEHTDTRLNYITTKLIYLIEDIEDDAEEYCDYYIDDSEDEEPATMMTYLKPNIANMSAMDTLLKMDLMTAGLSVI